MIYTLERYGYPILELDGKWYYVSWLKDIKEHSTVHFDNSRYKIIEYTGAFPNDYAMLNQFLKANIIKKVLDEST